jgi:cation diffusion facilitator CzcD-associated flavoprotein CzcO
VSSPRIVIIGAGFTGICAGIALKRAGIDRFTILERGQRLGGRWRDDADAPDCRLPALAHSFSFEPRPEWAAQRPSRDRLLDYLEHCARKYELMPRIRFGVDVQRGHFDATRRQWRIQANQRDEIPADVVICASGQALGPRPVTLPNADAFCGTVIDAAECRDTARGGRIGIVGDGSELARLVPRLADRADVLEVFVPEPDWVLPEPRSTLRGLPQPYEGSSRAFGAIARAITWADLEAASAAALRLPFAARLAQRRARHHLERQIDDPALRERLRPRYAVGSRPVVRSNDFYPALRHPHVRVSTLGIARLVADGAITAGGQHHPLDIIVNAQGVRPSRSSAPPLTGITGETLDRARSGASGAYLGVALPDFPNLFTIGAPGTHIGGHLNVFMIECQAGYVTRCVRRLRDRRANQMQLRDQALLTYSSAVARTRARLGPRVPAGDWPWSTLRYWWKTLEVDASAYEWA